MFNLQVDIEKPRYDQNTYVGRAKHFFITTNPLNLFKSTEELNNAKEIVVNYRNGRLSADVTENDLWKCKSLYDSAFHPETGEKMILFGRMSFQVPGNMLITGGMLHFFRRLATSYVLATSGAVTTALLVNRQVVNFPPLIGRLVPFVAVAAANCVNIPCMRSQELTTGISVTDEEGQHLGNSTTAASKAIVQVTASRICMAVPGMTIPPIIMNMLEKKGILAKHRWCSLPLQIFLCGFILTFATPLGCAIFPQQSSIAFKRLEPDLQQKIKENYKGSIPSRVYYNKGL